MQLKLDQIRVDGGTQIRADLNTDTIAEYAELMEAGTKLPDIIVFFDGDQYWLADGFHRYYAAKRQGAERVAVEKRDGSQRDAILFAVGANAEHGARRTNDDKRKAVQTLLEDPEWSKWSDREISRRCKVDHTMVADHRKRLSGGFHQMRTAERGGNTYEINTSNIGKSRKTEVLEVVNTITGEAMEPEDVDIVKSHPMRNGERKAGPKTQSRLFDLADEAIAMASKPFMEISPAELKKVLKELRAELVRAFQ